MPESSKPAAQAPAEVAGEFLDHETGRSHTYVARFRTVASDVLWSARVKLGGRWVTLRGGRVRDAGDEQDDFVVSELVRDSVLDNLNGYEMDEALERARRQARRAAILRWVIAALAVCAAGGGFWFWKT